MGYVRLAFEDCQHLLRRVFTAYGFSSQESAVIVDGILTADLYGIESHGLQRMVRYDAAIKCGMVNITAKPEVVFETPVSAVLDARDAMGQLVSVQAMHMAMEKAKKGGVGMVTVRASNHFGIAGYYTGMAAAEDLIGVCMTNSEAIMVPTHGRKAMLGTNPISVAMPADPHPFIFDAATTVVPRGKLEVCSKKGQPLPAGWAVDTGGNVCVSPDEVLHNIVAKAGGGILPLGGESETTGGHKGYGFGLICELFTSVLAGGAFSHESYIQPEKADTAHCFWAIDYGIFGDKGEIRRRFSALLDELRHSPKKEGAQRIYVHGDKELEACRRNRREGLPVNEKTLAELREIVARLALSPEDFSFLTVEQ